jgi:cysteine-rich CWC protein
MTPVNTCPRCGKPFHCGAHDDAPCACTALRLEPSTLARLRREHVGCLCVECLREEARRDAGAADATTSMGRPEAR